MSAIPPLAGALAKGYVGRGGAPRPASPHEDRVLCARCALGDAPAEALGLDADEAGVEAARCHERGVRAPLGHVAVVKHHDGALNEIARTNPAAPGAGLVYEEAARMLLSSLVGTAAAALPEDRRARVGILAAMELANSRWRDGASQEEAASVAGMGVTRFKSLFKQATAGTSGNRNPSDAAARHTLLALSHQPFPSGTTRYKNSALTW